MTATPEPDEAARILLAAAETVDREGITERYAVNHAIRMAAEEVMELGPVRAGTWFERALGRFYRYVECRDWRSRPAADWATRLRGAAEIEPLESPRWPYHYGY